MPSAAPETIAPPEPSRAAERATRDLPTALPPEDSPSVDGQTDPPRRLSPGRVRSHPSLSLSLNGLIYIGLILFVLTAAINAQVNLLFGVAGLMLGVLLASWLISRQMLRGVVTRRTLPEAADVGQPARFSYEFSNRKRWWPSLSLTLAELDAPGVFDRQPRTYLMHAPPGTTQTVVTEVVPLQRGLHVLERYQLISGFPFGFIRRAMRRKHRDTLLVRPAQGAVEPRAMLRFLSAQSSGINQRPREGGYDEFFGAREYRYGDPVRMIHWRRSARTAALQGDSGQGGTLVVKQMTRVSPPRLVLMVDTYVPPRPEPAYDANRRRHGDVDEKEQEHRRRLAAVERNIAVAASLLAAATRKGLSVGLVAWFGDELPHADDPADNGQAGRNGHAPLADSPLGQAGLRGDPHTGESAGGWLELKPERGKRHRRDILASLARLPRNAQHQSSDLLERGRRLVKGDTTGVLVTAAGRDDGALDGAESQSSSGGDAGTPATAARPGAPSRATARSARSNIVVVNTASRELDQWVRFAPEIDFTLSVPVGQLAELPASPGRTNGGRR